MVGGSAMEPAAPRRVGHAPQLLIDDSLVSAATHVTRTVHPATKQPEPVLAADPERPWEDGGEGLSKRLCLYGTVLRLPPGAGTGGEGAKWGLWYCSCSCSCSGFCSCLLRLRFRLHLPECPLHSRPAGRYMCRMGPPGVSAPHRIPELYMPRDNTKPPTFEGQRADAHGREFVDNDQGDLTCYAESTDGVR